MLLIADPLIPRRKFSTCHCLGGLPRDLNPQSKPGPGGSPDDPSWSHWTTQSPLFHPQLPGALRDFQKGQQLPRVSPLANQHRQPCPQPSSALHVSLIHIFLYEHSVGPVLPTAPNLKTSRKVKLDSSKKKAEDPGSWWSITCQYLCYDGFIFLINI